MGQEFKRRKYFIDSQFQSKFILRFSFVVVLSTFLVGAIVFFMSRHSTTVAIENTRVLIKPTSDFILPLLISTFLIVSFVAAWVGIFLTLITSHRIVGPAYRLTNEVKRFSAGDLKVNFNIRQKDQLRDLADSLAEMSGTYKEKHEALDARFAQLKGFIEEHHYCLGTDDTPKVKQMIEDIDQSLNFFNSK